MEINAEITGINYKVMCNSPLETIAFDKFDINSTPTSFILTYDQNRYGVSKWVSPKRTRSYPYVGIYNTYNCAKKITIIPVIKDEGAGGDRDFIQWDTISLMSLLDVYVVLAYYSDAKPHKKVKDKITKQKFDSDYIRRKIIELDTYKSSALHWNINEVKQNLPDLVCKVQSAYKEISDKLKIQFHRESEIENFKKQIIKGSSTFIKMSRGKAQKAQLREMVTTQPKESLLTSTKASISIKNYLGGLYYFTTDETLIDGDNLLLIEGKHSVRDILPAVSDIKDGLLKMVLYSNLKVVKINDKKYETKPVLKLTSQKLKGSINTNTDEVEIEDFIRINAIKAPKAKFIKLLLVESKENNFEVIISGGN